jgi:hypothetical protein
VLAAKTVGFPSGSDKTIVATKKSPKVLVFDNAKLGIQPVASGSALAIRHTADLGFNTVRFDYQLWESVFQVPLPPSAAADESLNCQKGDQFASGIAASVLRFQVVALRTDGVTEIRESEIFEVKPLRRYEIYLVGTSAANSKLVRVTSTLSSAP